MSPKVLLLLAAGATIVILAVVLPLILKRKPTAETSLPFRKRDHLLTAAERSFFEVLSSLLDSNWLVVPKVRLADLVYLPKGTNHRQGLLNRVTSKHVDFVLCDRKNLTPWLVVELDDSSHERADRQARDAFVDQVLGAASLPVLHVSAKKGYSPDQLSQQITEKLQNLSSIPPTA